MPPDEQKPPGANDGEPDDDGRDEQAADDADTPVPDQPAGDGEGEGEDVPADDAGGEGEDVPADDAGGEDAPVEDAGPAPEYKVYRAGSEGPVGTRRAQQRGSGGSGDRPDYKVYRSRPSFFDRFRRGEGPALGGFGADRGERAGRGDRGRRGRFDRLRSLGGGGSGRRRWLRYALIGAGVWLLISFVAFAVSAQIQKGQLSDQAKDALEGGPELLAGQNILILGGDKRTGKAGANEPGADPNVPPRADTIIVMHASLTSFRKLSIPRDVQAEVPGFGAEKINSAFSASGKRNGDAALMIRTVSDFLGIDIHHLVIVDFEGFADFIDALGGVTIDVPRVKGRPANRATVCGDINGGKSQGGISLKLKPGKITLESQKALAFARLRKNDCDPSEDDRDRAARQQLVLNGIKSRLTSPIRFPINFIKGPLIGWAAPKAFISDMGGATLPQLAIAAIIGGSGKENVLKPSTSVGGNLIIPGSECERAVRELTGGAPDRDPVCSPG